MNNVFPCDLFMTWTTLNNRSPNRHSTQICADIENPSTTQTCDLCWNDSGVTYNLDPAVRCRHPASHNLSEHTCLSLSKSFPVTACLEVWGHMISFNQLSSSTQTNHILNCVKSKRLDGSLTEVDGGMWRWWLHSITAGAFDLGSGRKPPPGNFNTLCETCRLLFLFSSSHWDHPEHDTNVTHPPYSSWLWRTPHTSLSEITGSCVYQIRANLFLHTTL